MITIDDIIYDIIIYRYIAYVVWQNNLDVIAQYCSYMCVFGMCFDFGYGFRRLDQALRLTVDSFIDGQESSRPNIWFPVVSAISHVLYIFR